METILERLREIDHLVLPNQPDQDRTWMSNWLVNPIMDAETDCLLPCRHQFPSPATEAEIKKLSSLNISADIPDQLIELLRLTNGPNLFQLEYKGLSKPWWYTIYNILGTEELVEENKDLLEETYLSYAEEDIEMQGITQLNYVAFCDIGDGNFLSIALDKPDRGKVFYLDHDYLFYPYGIPFTKDAYIVVADSIEEWLEQLVTKRGIIMNGDSPIYG